MELDWYMQQIVTETYSISVADKSVITPLIYDENYIEFLLHYCLENNIKVVISLFDIDLPVLDKNKKDLPNTEFRLLLVI